MLNSLNQILTDMFGPLGPLVAVGALGMIGIPPSAGFISKPFSKC